MSWYSKLFNYFPPPAYLKMPFAGIYFNDDGIRVMSLSEDKIDKLGRLEILFHDFFPCPVGAIVNGNIEDEQATIECLKKIKNKYDVEYVSGNIPDDKVYIFKTTIKKDKDVKIDDAIKYLITETVPVPLPQAVYDFSLTNETDSTMDIVVRVVHKKVSGAIERVLDKAGLKPLFLKTSSEAIADATLGANETDPHMIITFGKERSICSIVADKTVQFSTSIDIGEQDFIFSIMKGLSVDKDDAQKIIYGGNSDKCNHEDVFFSCTNVMSSLRGEVLKVKEFWTSKEAMKNIVKVYISGPMSIMVGLTSHLETLIGIKLAIVDPWKNTFDVHDQVPDIFLQEALEYVGAIGLALPHKLHF